MPERIPRSVFTQRPGPLIGNYGQMRIGAASDLRNLFRERIGKILVVANAESISFHDDVTAKIGFMVEQGHQRRAFFNRQNPVRHGIPAFRERLLCILPIRRINSLRDS